MRRSYIHERQAKKSHRLLLFAGLSIVIILLLSAYGFVTMGKRSTISTNQTETPQVLTSSDDVTKNVDLEWPVTGQAAVGSVEHGILGSSSSNENARPIASMAKVITALAVMEKQPFELGNTGPSFSITKKDIESMSAYIEEEGSVQPLLIGMKLTEYQALERMLMASDNNVADILVERIFGSQEAYVLYANNMLKRMGLEHTTVADASGFSSDTVSTPADLITIGIAALKNPVIAHIVAQQQTQLPVADRYLTLTNTNQLLGTDGVIGIKTGTTGDAGSCLLFAARYRANDGNEGTLVGVIMGDKDHASLYKDSKNLLASAKESLGASETQTTENDILPMQEAARSLK